VSVNKQAVLAAMRKATDAILVAGKPNGGGDAKPEARPAALNPTRTKTEVNLKDPPAAEKQPRIEEGTKAVPAAGTAPKGEADPTAILTYACGHRVGVRHLQGSRCPHCQAAMRRQRLQVMQAQRPQLPGRLPDGAVFSVAYDAASTTWSGTLTIPATGAEYTGRAAGVHKLLRRLGQECLATMATTKEAVPLGDARAE
jgi:hypothetical protein